jgi:uncharacterized membrane protein
MTENLITFIGRFHPLWVHLPIGFLILAVLLKAYVVLGKKPALQEAVIFALLLGTISALIAAFLGFLLSQSGGYDGDLLDIHLIAGWTTVIVSGIAWWTNKNEQRFSEKLNYGILGFLILILSLTGHYGGSLTHGEDYLTAYAPFGGKQEENKGRVPARSVVIPGSYTKQYPAGEYQVPCALIIGQRKESTDKKTSLNSALRDFNVAV